MIHDIKNSVYTDVVCNKIDIESNFIKATNAIQHWYVKSYDTTLHIQSNQ